MRRYGSLFNINPSAWYYVCVQLILSDELLFNGCRFLASGKIKLLTDILLFLEGCISCYQEKRNDKVKDMHLVMARLNSDQDVANNRERKQTAAHIVAKSYPIQQTVEMCRYGSLININHSGFSFKPSFCMSFFTVRDSSG